MSETFHVITVLYNINGDRFGRHNIKVMASTVEGAVAHVQKYYPQLHVEGSWDGVG